MSLKLRYLYRAYRYRWRVDPAEIRFVCERLKPGQIAVDIGCHKGAYTYWMRQSVGRGGVVHAFEPQPRQYAYLLATFDEMRYDNVLVNQSAVSDHYGRMQLHVPSGKGETHAASIEARGESYCESIDVQVVSLDYYFDDYHFDGEPRGPDFLKIDVEGHELAVLQGARQTLEKYRPAILLECEARHRADGDVRPVFELLQSFGYEGSFFQGRSRRPLAEFDAAIHQRIDPATPAQLPPGYVNNFAFIAAE